MSKILVLGHGPLPFENETKLFGPGIRAWQFAKPLIGDGHDLTVVCSRIPFVYKDSLPDVTESKREGMRYYSVAQPVFEDGTFLQGVLDRFNPDCIVAATVFPSAVASSLQTDRPLWADLFGDTMAEAQAKAYTYTDDTYLQHFWSQVRTALDRGDIFSAVSDRQKYALIGQLGTRGRLSRRSHGYEFVQTIPCAIEPIEPSHAKQVLRGRCVDAEDFVVLWSGGYNTWTDVDTLFRGLEKAMAKNRRIKFASTGGQIDGHDEVTYPRFLRLIDASPYKDHFVMAGWVPTEDVASYYFESDVGINIDAPNYEALLGSRNRLLQWMSVGLPVLTTETSEITDRVRTERLGYVFEHGNAESLSEAILELADDRDALRAAAERAKRYVYQHWTFDTTTKSLRCWARQPTVAPDRGHQIYLERPTMPRFAATSVGLQKAVSRAATRPSVDGGPLTLASVIVVTYNSQADLGECLEALAATRGCAFEVIVVDNASADGSVALAQAADPKATIIRNDRNLGFGGAINVAYERCRGDIIAVVNPDVAVRPDWLQALLEELRQSPEVGIVGSKLLYPDHTTIQHAGGSIAYPLSLPGHFGYGEKDRGQCDTARDVDYVTGAAFAVRRSVLETVGLFDEDFFPAYFEEADLCFRAQQAGYLVRYVPSAVAIHRESVTTGTESATYYHLFHRNRLRFVVKHYSDEQLWRDFLPAELARLHSIGTDVEREALAKAYAENLAKVEGQVRDLDATSTVADATPENGRRGELLRALVASANSTVSASVARQAQLRDQIAALSARSQIVEPTFVSNAPIVGPFIVRFRYLWNWMATKWFVRPIIQQQSEFNAAVVAVLSDVADLTAHRPSK